MRFEFDVPCGSEQELREHAAKGKVSITHYWRGRDYDTATCETDSKLRALFFAQDFVAAPDVRKFLRFNE